MDCFIGGGWVGYKGVGGVGGVGGERGTGVQPGGDHPAHQLVL